MAIITQKDIIEVVRANIEIMEEIIETIDGTSYLKDKKKYDDKAISEHVKFLYGDPDKPKSGGRPSGLISELVVANDCLAKLAKVKVVESKKIKKNAAKIINSINDVIEAVNENMPADIKDIDQVTKNITNVKKIVDALMSVSKDIFILALISPLLVIAALLAIISVLVIIAFVWVVVTLMNMIKATVSKEQLQAFERVRALCRCLIIIDLEIIILALLAPIASIAAVIALLGLGILTLCVLGMVFMLNFMVKLIKKVYDELAIVSMFFIVLILILGGISLGLLVVALIATVVVQLIPEVLIFLGMLIGVIIMLTVIGFILSKMTGILIDAMIGLILLTVIMVLITAVAVMLLIVAACAIFIVDHIGELFAFFGILMGVVAMMMVLGTILMVAMIPLAFCIVGLALLAVVVTELIVVATELLILSLFKLNESKIGQVVDAITNSLMLIVFKLILLAFPGLHIMVMQILKSLGLLLGVVAELIVAATELLILQSFNLDEKKLDKNVSTITNSMYNIGLRLLPLAMPWLLAVFGWLLANVGLLLGVMVEFVAIGKKIQELADLTIDEKKVMSNVTSIFNVLDLIFERLGDKKKANMRKKIARKAKKMFKHIRTALEYVSDIVNDFMKPIMDLELKERPIMKKVDVIFNTLDYIFERLGDKKAIRKRKKLAKNAKRMFKHIYSMMEYMNSIVNDFMKPITELELKERAVIKKVETIFNTLDYVFNRLGDAKGMKTRKKLAKQAKKMMKPVKKVMDSINAIVDCISGLMEISIKEKTIIKNLDAIFGSLDHMFSKFGDKKAMKARKKAAKNAKKMLKHVGQVIDIVQKMVEVLNSLQEIKLKQRKIQNNLDLVWETIESIETQIKNKTDENGGGLKGLFNSWKKSRQQKNFTKDLGRIGKIVEILHQMCEALNGIQDIKLKSKKITDNLDAVWLVIDNIESQIKSKIPEDQGFFKGLFTSWKKKVKDQQFIEQLGRIGKIVEIVGTMCTTLNSLQEMKLDEGDIKSGLSAVWAAVDDIEAQIKIKTAPKEEEKGFFGWFRMWGRKMEEAQQQEEFEQYMGRIGKICASISTTVDLINKLSEIKIDRATITNNLAEVFDTIEFLENEIKKYTNSIDWGKVSKRIGFGRIGSYRGSMETRIETMEQAQELLGPAAEVITSISTAIEAMDSLQNLKLSKKKIKRAIEEFFNFLDNELVPIIEGSMKNKGDKKETFYDNAIAAIDDRKKIFDKLNEIQPYFEQLTAIANFKISKSGLIEELTYLMCDLPLALYEKLSTVTESQLETITDQVGEIGFMIKDLVKINKYIEPIRKIGQANLNPKTLGKNMEIVFYDIPSILSKAVDEFKMNTSKSKKIGLLIGTIEDVQDVLKDFNVSNSQVENQKKMTENYIKFLDKIDKVDNSNLKTSVSLFEQMARLSESISGNFDGLAQAINDKIAPLLEELNKLLEEVPEKIKEKTGGGSEGGSESESESKSEEKKVDEKNIEKGIDEVVTKLSKLIRVATDIKDVVDY